MIYLLILPFAIVEENTSEASLLSSDNKIPFTDVSPRANLSKFDDFGEVS